MQTGFETMKRLFLAQQQKAETMPQATDADTGWRAPKRMRAAIATHQDEAAEPAPGRRGAINGDRAHRPPFELGVCYST